MKNRNLLRLSLLISLLSTTACTPNNAEPNASVARGTPSKDSAIPMTRIAPMKMGQSGATDRPLARRELDIAPDFDSKNLAGDTVRLSDFKDSIIVLDFWATWCGPCIASFPHTQAVAERYKDQGVVVLAVCTSDTNAMFESWMSENQSKYPDLVFTCDPNEKDSATYDERASRRLYGVAGIPTQFVIGRDGKIAAVLVGNLKDDARLEAGLARVGIQVDPNIVEKGESQIQKMTR